MLYVDFFLSNLLSILFIFIFLYAIYEISKDSPFSKCLVYENFKMLCPTCGGTRSVIAFAQLDWIKSFENHPVFFYYILFKKRENRQIHIVKKREIDHDLDKEKREININNKVSIYYNKKRERKNAKKNL